MNSSPIGTRFGASVPFPWTRGTEVDRRSLSLRSMHFVRKDSPLAQVVSCDGRFPVWNTRTKILDPGGIPKDGQNRNMELSGCALCWAGFCKEDQNYMGRAV